MCVCVSLPFDVCVCLSFDVCPSLYVCFLKNNRVETTNESSLRDPNSFLSNKVVDKKLKKFNKKDEFSIEEDLVWKWRTWLGKGEGLGLEKKEDLV